MAVYVRRFLRWSLIWLAVGVALGLGMVVAPVWSGALRTAHLHANLLGFVSFMIFGVAYHVLPRFTGQALRYPRLPSSHFFLSNVGLMLLVGSWVLRPLRFEFLEVVIGVGGALAAGGAALFIVNLWGLFSAKAPATGCGGMQPASGPPPLLQLKVSPKGEG
jgi:hypothetical protein